ncbi:hypothetical protein E5D57_012416 [Metarhizium anisopliae]|nr:hypothetical protein E5D57_012416 [Metarhizium anisopliae]
MSILSYEKTQNGNGADGIESSPHDADEYARPPEGVRLGGRGVAALGPQEGDFAHARRRAGVVEDAADGEAAGRGVKGKGDEGVAGALVEGDAVVEVQLAAGAAARVKGNEQLKGPAAQVGGGEGGAEAGGDDGAAAQEQRDGGGVDGRDGEGAAGAPDRAVRVPVVEEGAGGQVDLRRGGAGLEDGGDQQRRPVEVLVLEGAGGAVARVGVQHGQQGGLAGGRGAPHRRVQVVEEAVADGEGAAGAGGDRGPAVELLRRLPERVVVAVEGGEGAEGCPPRAQLLGRVAAEAAHVGAHGVEAVQRGEGQHGAHRGPVHGPRGEVVAEPVADARAGPGEGGPRDDEGPQPGPPREHGRVRRRRHHGPVEVVRIVHGQPVLVPHVRVDRVVGEPALRAVPGVLVRGLVVDGVPGVEQVAAREALLVAGGGGDCFCCAGSRCSRRGLGGRWRRGGGGAVAVGGVGGLQFARPAGQRARRRADGRRGRRVALGGGVGVVAGEVAGEVAGLVHVDPEGVNVDARVAVEEAGKHGVPVGAGVAREPVREDGHAGPHDAQPRGAVGALEEDVLLEARRQRRVVLVGHGRVDHDDVVLVARVQVRHERAHLVQREALRVEREDAPPVHVVNVRPHGLERDVGPAVVVDDLGHVKHVLVAVSGVRRHGRAARNLGVLLDDGGGRLAGKEPKVEHAAERVVLEVLAAVAGLVNDHVHAVGVEEEDAVRPAVPVLKVDGVRAVQVGARGDAVAVLVPERADVARPVEAEGVRVLAEPVEVRVLRQPGAQPHVLRLEDERRRRRVEEHLVRVAAADLEGKGRRRVVEPEPVCRCRRRAAGPREDGLGHLVYLVVLVLDLDVEAVVCPSLAGVVAVRVASLARKREMGRQPGSRRLDVERLVAGTLGQGLVPITGYQGARRGEAGKEHARPEFHDASGDGTCASFRMRWEPGRLITSAAGIK